MAADGHLGMDTITIEGLDEVLDREEDYIYPEDEDEGEDYGEDGIDPEEEEGEDEAFARTDTVDPKIAQLESQVAQLTNILAGKSDDREEVKEYDPTDDTTEIIGAYKEVLDEMADDDKLSTQQAKALSAQIGENLIPALLKTVEKKYGKKLDDLEGEYQKVKHNFTESERTRAVNVFFKKHSAANNSKVIEALDADLKADPVWKNLLENPNEEKMYNHLIKTFSPYAEKAKALQKRVERAKKNKTSRQNRVTSTAVRDLGDDTNVATAATQKRKPSMAQVMEAEFRKQLRKR
jgi:hypothetical protein